jgi:hypothetical protein
MARWLAGYRRLAIGSGVETIRIGIDANPERNGSARSRTKVFKLAGFIKD